jgi:hypothetical protein
MKYLTHKKRIFDINPGSFLQRVQRLMGQQSTIKPANEFSFAKKRCCHDALAKRWLIFHRKFVFGRFVGVNSDGDGVKPFITLE